MIDMWGTFQDTARLTADQANELIDKVYFPEFKNKTIEGLLTNNSSEKTVVSIIIPIYNSEKYLKECIDSVLNQKTNVLFEVICVDDGSNDMSYSILQGYDQDNRVRIFSQDNQGAAAARNNGVRNALGKYIVFVDSDDVLSPDFIDVMLNKAKTTNADIVKCGYRIINRNQLSTTYIHGKDSVITEARHSEIYKYNGSCCGMLIKREMFSRCSFPVGSWYEDMTTRLIFYANCNIFSYVAKALYFYRMHESNTSAKVEKGDNIKCLDQIILLQKLYLLNRESGVNFDSALCLAHLYEMGFLLYSRTRNLDRDIKCAAFLLACVMHDNLEKQCTGYYNHGTLLEKLLGKAFQTRDYLMWEKVCSISVLIQHGVL